MKIDWLSSRVDTTDNNLLDNNNMLTHVQQRAAVLQQWHAACRLKLLKPLNYSFSFPALA